MAIYAAAGIIGTISLFFVYKLYWIQQQLMNILLFFSFLSLLLLTTQFPQIFHVPLDQRFTTRVAFLNMAAITPFDINTLPDQLLPRIKQYQPPEQSIQWLKNQVNSQKISNQNNAGILSLETLLYGSLIASRISNDSEQLILEQRVSSLLDIFSANKNLSVYISAVVMRIPKYSLDFEQPSYWAQYGAQLFTYSYFLDKFSKTHDLNDQKQYQDAQQKIPPQILQEFLWRRQRNHHILLYLLNEFGKNKELFSAFYITLDDNAEYGLNIAESEELREKVKELGLENKVKIYPGADEVSLSLLAKFTTDYTKSTPVVAMYFRNDSTISYVPNYQGQPLISTVQSQIEAAGGSPVNGTLLKRGNITLLINNFDETHQIQAPNQQSYQNLTVDYNSAFLSKLCYPTQDEVYGFADSRFSNGADIKYVNWILNATKSCSRSLDAWTYAGWNTNGNTLGSVISNSIILLLSKKLRSSLSQTQSLHLFHQSDQSSNPCPKFSQFCPNAYITALRILEDRDWQAILRQNLRSYIQQVPGDDINDLSTDLPFYEQFTFKSLSSKLRKLKTDLLPVSVLEFQLSRVDYPWNRTFQIGLYGKMPDTMIVQ